MAFCLIGMIVFLALVYPGALLIGVAGAGPIIYAAIVIALAIWVVALARDYLLTRRQLRKNP